MKLGAVSHTVGKKYPPARLASWVSCWKGTQHCDLCEEGERLYVSKFGGLGSFRYGVGLASSRQRSVCFISSGTELQFEKLF